MRNFRITCLLVVVLGTVALMLAPGAALAANQVVNNCNDDTELRSDLAAMQSGGGGILSFNCGVKTIVLAGGVLPTITTATYIEGSNKITLSGNNASRIFYVGSGGSLSLYNITLTKGASGGDGGAIYNQGTLDINSSKFLENTSGASGGAIITYGPLYVVGSEFARNKGVNGGAIYPRWGAAVTTISASWIHHNETTGTDTSDGMGGALLLWDGPPITISNSTLDHNKARRGGAFFVTKNSTLTLESSTLSANAATPSSGGAIYNEGTVTATNSTLSGNTATYTGGGIDNYFTGYFSFTNSTFSGNSAQFGGAIDNTKASGELTNVTITGNSASFSGGGINNGTYGDQGINAKNTLVSNNPGGNCFDGNAKTINSLGFNLSNDSTCTEFFDQGGDQNNVNPLLGGLAANGGPTQTHMLLAGSPAQNGGTGSGAPTTDQRGIPRPQGSAVDIGAVEVCAKPAKPGLISPAEGKKVKPTQVPLDWGDTVCASTYKVQVKLGATNGPNAYTKGGLTASQDTTASLTKGQTYFWRVTAINSVGKAKSAWQSFKVK